MRGALGLSLNIGFGGASKFVFARGITYFVDATGGLDTNTGVSSGDAWQTIAKVNATSLAPGDTVLFKSGETWIETLAPTTSGTIGKTITFGTYGSGNKPLINVTGQVLLAAMTIPNLEYITVDGLALQGGSEGSLHVSGTSGSSSIGYTVNVKNTDVIENLEGDGFDQKGSSQVTYTNITATDCHRDTATDTSDQGLTLHNTSKAKVYTASFTDCNYGVTNIDTSVCELHNITVSGSYRLAIKADGAAVMDFYDSSITVDRATAKIGGSVASSAGSVLTLNDTTIDVTLADPLNLPLGSTTRFVGCTFNVASSMQYRITQNNTTLSVENSFVNVSAALSTSGLFAKTSGTGCVLNVSRTVCTGTGAGKAGIIIYGGAAGADSSTRSFVYNIVRNMTKPVVIPGGGQMDVFNNVFYNDVVEGVSVTVQSDTTTVEVKNNIFSNITNSILQFASTVISNNDYFNSSDEGGTGSITSDPVFVNAAAEDFNLQSSSLCINAGVDVGETTDFDGKTVPNGGYDIGAYEWYA